MRASQSVAAGLLLLARSSVAIDVDASDSQSVIDAAGTIAASVMAWYTGAIPGLFPDPYYFWESGLAWDTTLYYAALTGDDQYNDAISQALTFQVGPDNNYMPPNQSKSIGNDDQSYWAFAALTAEMTGFPPPQINGVDSWLELAQNVFDGQVARWDDETCDGGLRWQIFSFNNGYDYKNTQSNGNFMQLAGRLYEATRNETYLEWFIKAADWMTEVGFIDTESGRVFDGASTRQQCGSINRIQWTANAGTVLAAYASVINASADVDTTPLRRILATAAETFTTDNDDDILTEPACLPNDTCNVDQLAFRAVLGRALALFKANDEDVDVNAILAASAEAAAANCLPSELREGKADCRADWTRDPDRGSSGDDMGLGQDLSALNVLLANLPQEFKGAGAAAAGYGTASNSTGTSTGGATGSSSSANASGSAQPEQQEGNVGATQRAVGVGTLAAVWFAAAFLL